MKKKNQTVTATEENVIDFIRSNVYLFIDTLRQLGASKKFEHEQAMRMLNAKFGDSIGEELMDKASKALEEHGIVDTEKKKQEVKEEVKQEVKQEVKKETKQEVKEKKQAKWVLSKAVKIDAFERMLEEAWTDSGLEDESIRQAVRDKLAKWYKLDGASPLAGFSRHYRPQSQEALEMKMYESFDMQFSQYDGYRENDIEEILRQLEMKQLVKDENLKKAEWEYFYDATDYKPYVQATATIDGETVTVGYLWDEQEGGCFAHVNGSDVRDRGVCEHCCEVVEKIIGETLTEMPYELWECWAGYKGRYEDWVYTNDDERYENWEDTDDDERHELYYKGIVQR